MSHTTLTRNEARLLDSIQKHGYGFTISDYARLWKRSGDSVAEATRGLLKAGLVEYNIRIFPATLKFSKAAEKQLKAAGVDWKK